jgi:hypothetical protein
MENKFKKATRRITTIAATAALVSSSVFGASLSDYPNNFVDNDIFDGQVVIGNSADSAAATSVISDLKSDLSGGSKVKITAKKSASGGGDSFKILDSGKVMKYGSSLFDVKPTAIDDKDMSILEDQTFNNGVDDQEYEQTVTFYDNGHFERALRDEFETEISTHLFIEDTNVFNYTLDMKSDVTFDGTATSWDADFVGETISILGAEYTIISVTKGQSADDSLYGLTSLELVGGANKISLGEGDTTSVVVEGVTYEISVQSVATDKVLMTINGESASVDELDTKEIAGINIAVTDVVSSSRDAVKGYASLVIGGSKIKLTDDSEVEVNEKDVSALFDNYKVMTYFDNNGASSAASDFGGFTLTYSLENEVLLADGEIFDDKVFNVLGIKYDGMNDVEYETMRLSTSSNKLNLAGMTLKGEEFNEEIAMLYDDAQATTTPTVLIGNGEDDRMLTGSFAAVTTGALLDDGVISAAYGLYVDTITEAVDATVTSLVINGQTFTDTNLLGDNILVDGFNLTVLVDGGTTVNSVAFTVNGISFREANGMRFITGDLDDQQIYEFGTYSSSNSEIDVTDILTNDKDDNVAVASLASKLDDLTTSTVVGDHYTVLSTLNSEVLFANEYVVDLSQIAIAATTTSAGGDVTIYTDYTDLNADLETGDQAKFTGGAGDGKDIGDFPAITIDLTFDTTDDEFDLTFKKTESTYVLLSGAEADVSSENNKIKEYSDAYGTIIRVDDDDSKYIEIEMPDMQVEANVYLTAGAVSDSISTFTVDNSASAAKVKELEDDGYTVTTETVTTSAIEFDISAPVMATEVSGMSDMIVVGGPAVNMVAAKLLGVNYPSYGAASGLNAGEAVVRYFSNSNSVLVYGWDSAGTTAAANKLNSGGLSGMSIDVQ